MSKVEWITIKTTKSRFFYEYLVLKRPVINIILTKFNKRNIILHDKLLSLLAELLYLNDYYSDLPEEVRWGIIFNQESRKKIMEKLGLKEHYLNNYLSILRRIKVIVDGRINKIFLMPAINTDLTFRFEINGYGDE
jgi:hypothetical protein